MKYRIHNPADEIVAELEDDYKDTRPPHALYNGVYLDFVGETGGWYNYRPSGLKDLSKLTNTYVPPKEEPTSVPEAAAPETK